MAKKTMETRSRPTAGRLIDRAWMWLEKRFEHEPHRARRWEQVGEALEAVERRREALGGLAGDQLTGALEAWLGGADAAAIRYLEEASAKEVIEEVNLSARALEVEAQRREEQREALLSLARELGAIGIKMVLGVLVAV